MGNLCQPADQRELLARTKKIERQMRTEYRQEAQVIKLLLLGTGECGKSTILKQLKILHNNGFTDDEVTHQRKIIYSNAVQSMYSMLNAMPAMKIRLEKTALESDAQLVVTVATARNNADGDRFSDELLAALKNLWSDEACQVAFKRRNEYQLDDSAKYFFDDIDRIGQKDYIPTAQDILHTRLKTTGFVEVPFTIKTVKFRVFDVGGQRSERRKWIHLFDGVNAIIFLTAINEYDQVLFEDGKTNRMIESLKLFDMICNCQFFTSTTMILFLNKRDLFAEKIKIKNISVCFPDYKGDQEYSAAVQYIASKFEGVNQSASKSIYIHETCATDTNQVELVMDSVVDSVIQKNMQSVGFVKT